MFCLLKQIQSQFILPCFQRVRNLTFGRSSKESRQDRECSQSIDAFQLENLLMNQISFVWVSLGEDSRFLLSALSLEEKWLVYLESSVVKKVEAHTPQETFMQIEALHLEKDNPIICAGLNLPQVRRVCKKLEEMGYINVYFTVPL